MSTLEIDVGDLRPRSVEFTDSELVVTLTDGRKIATPLELVSAAQRCVTARQRGNFELHADGNPLARSR